MRKTRKILLGLTLTLILASLVAVPAFAVTEAEVQQQVNAVGKEAVTGNIFIWFLCAIGFLKVSQKIDSFMSSLGINVGHTGGSMLAEALIAARGVATVKSFGGGYAADIVERKPYKAPDGNIAYNESIVKKLPDPPKRKDRI